MKPATLLARAAPIYLLVAFAMIVLHELGHAVAALALHAPNVVLYDTHVATVAPSKAAAITIAAAGSVASVFVGLLGFGAYRASRGSRPELRLASLWVAYFGLVEPLGYLLLTPFGGNDFGGIAIALGLPPLASWGCFAAGLFGLTRLTNPLVGALGRLAPSPDHLKSGNARATFVACVAVGPWLIMVALGVVLPLITGSLGDISLAQKLGINAFFIGIGMPLVAAMLAARGEGDLKTEGPTWGTTVSWITAALFVALLAFYELVLTRGLKLR